MYVMLLELLRDAENRQLVFNPKHLAFAMNEPDVELVRRVVQEYGLFNLDDQGKFTSPWLEAQMAEYDAKKAAAVAAGKRGAARRYGRPEAPQLEENRDPMGGAMATEQIPNSNITQYNQQNEINPTKSKLLGMTWRDMTGKDLFSLARKKEPLIDDMSRKVIAERQKEFDAKHGPDRYNFMAILDDCDYFSVGVSMFAWLVKYTNSARIGTPEMDRLGKLVYDCRNAKFVPKYGADYLLTKLLEPLQGQ